MSSRKFAPDWLGLWRFMRDPRSDWKPKVAVAVAILYLIWPIDLVPDFAPILGWLDDIGVTALAVAYLFYASRKYLDEQGTEQKDAIRLIEKR